VAWHGHVTPEVAALLFPPVGEASPALKAEITPDPQPEHEVSDGEWREMMYREESQALVAD